jgi:aminopeptidase N
MLRFPFLLTCLSLAWLTGCQPASDSLPDAINDPHSYAKPAEARVAHLDLDLVVDFDLEVLRGTAVITVQRSVNATAIHLDAKQLTIESVKVSTDSVTLREVAYELGRADDILGQDLMVPLDKGDRFVHITYETGPEAEALQFLPPSLTAGDQPFLLTQSQAINARTWVPIQDGPGIRFPYHAIIQVPPGLMAVMSANNPTEVAPDGRYEFTMPQPIPAYLLALAVGDFAYQALDERSGVYAEPPVLDAAVFEFEDLPQMIDIAESLYGPYRWGRYDVIVLPASFPFGGMENPRITFATPTILAGDRSLVSLIAHELAHSWSGNLVTNATWNDFWLNEGFTVYFEYRIMEELESREYSEMLAAISYNDLKECVSDLGADNPDTRLFLDLKGRNPDDGVTAIAYDKGYYFLRRIEEAVGREAFDAFLRSYFDRHAFETMTTEGFLEDLNTRLLAQHPDAAEALNVQRWVYQPGIPNDLPAAKSTRFEAVEHVVNAWIAGVEPADLDTAGWSSHEWQHFVRVLPHGIEADKLAELDAAFHFSQSNNSEVQCEWYTRALRAKYTPAYPAVRTFLTHVGRRKFLTPLYRAMLETDGLADMARDIYTEARPTYHPIAIETLDKLIIPTEPASGV